MPKSRVDILWLLEQVVIDCRIMNGQEKFYIFLGSSFPS